MVSRIASRRIWSRDLEASTGWAAVVVLLGRDRVFAQIADAVAQLAVVVLEALDLVAQFLGLLLPVGR